MRRSIFILVVATIFPFFGKATHIVGGSITYEHLGGSTYRITQTLYRDCNGISLPGSTSIRITQPNGSLVMNLSIPQTSSSFLNPYIDTCAFNPGICIEEGIYSIVINNLPPNPGGYHMYALRCCRNGSLGNIVSPLNTGSAYYAKVSDNTQVLTNSSPEWVNFPPVFICANQPLNFDHSASDKDGDSLVYSLYTPYDDFAPTFPGNVATFTPVTWIGSYWAESPLIQSAAPTMFINGQTGMLTTVPANTGQYVVGVKCEEYRNGVKIGEIVRDFQFNVLNCPPPANAGIGPVNNCAGSSVTFQNTSGASATDFFWDFGDPLTTSDTSSQFQPSYTYPGSGPYTVTLITQPGTNCADTATQVLQFSWINAAFTAAPDSSCVSSTFNFSDASTTSGNSTVSSWNWDFGDLSTSTIPNPSHTYSTGGTYTVTLITTSSLGCTDTIQQTVWAQPSPTAAAGNDTVACTNNPTITLSGNVTNASGGFWVGAGTFNPNPNTLNADYTPTAAEIGAGFAQLILTTTGNGFCPSSTDTLLINLIPGPSVSAGSDLMVCKDTSGVPLGGSVAIATGGTWTSNGDGTFTPDPDSLNATYIPGSGDTAAGQVVLYLTSTGNGNCLANSDSMVITFTPLPSVNATAPPTACASDWIALNGSSSTGTGYWATLGDGNFVPGDTMLNTTYLPGNTDVNNGIVTMVFTTMNNQGCQPQFDTVNINIIPAPTAAYGASENCLNIATTFSDSSTTQVGTLAGWDWDFGDGNNDTLQNPAYTYSTPGTYQVTLIVTSDNGCMDTVTNNVIVHDLPVAGFGDTGPCLTSGTQFLDSSTVSDGTLSTWSWDFGDGGSDTAQNPYYYYSTSGNYAIQLIVTSSYGCKDTTIQSVSILPGPTAQFTLSDSTVTIGTDIQFTDLTDGSTIWSWTFGDSLGTSDQQNPVYAYSDAGIYTVMFVISDANGCLDSTYSDVIVFMPPQVPSAFSPNGDGANDFLYVYGGPYKDLEFSIYNNWGELIFISKNQTDGWNGQRDGKDQPIGVYIYTVRATTLDDVKHELRGDVTLLR